MSFDHQGSENEPAAPASLIRRLTGRIKIHPAGYGFVVPDDKSEDVHVSARSRGAAMDADTVEVEAWPATRGIEGRVLRVISRGRAKITGQLSRAGKQTILQPDDPRITGAVSLTGKIPGEIGQAVVAEITRYPDVPDGPLEAMDGGATFADALSALVKEHGLSVADAVLVAERAFRGGDGTRPRRAVPKPATPRGRRSSRECQRGRRWP